MKRNKLLLIALASTILFASCLKDKFNILDTDKSPSVVEFKNPGTSSSESPDGSLYIVFPTAMDVAPSVEKILEVQLTGPDPAPQDIVLTIGTSTTPVTEFNADKVSGNPAYPVFTPLPSANYSIVTPTVTIPKGQRSAQVKINFKTELFSFTTKYAVAFTITNTNYASISKNFGTILLQAIAKNRIDGRYTITATAPLVDATNAGITGLYPMTNMSLITQGATTAGMFDNRYALNGYAHPISSGGSTSQYGSFSPVFSVNAAGDVTAVTNYYGQPAANGRSAALNPAGVNKYNAATRTMEVSYFMVENGVNRTQFHEKWVYTSARP